MTYDVIVVGAGTAGIPAALEAARRGLKIALVEAGDDIGGTLHLSSASISAGGTAIQKRFGIEDSGEAHFRDALRINHGTGEHTLLRMWTDTAADMIDWLESIGWSCTPAEPQFAPEHDLYSVPRTYRSTDQGRGVIAAYRPQVDKAVADGSITLMLGTRMTGFVLDGETVTGITASKGEETLTVSAKATIVTTGGFSGNPRHWQELHQFVPLRYYIPTAQGDAIDAVRAIGGETWFEDYCLPAFGGTRDIGDAPGAWIHSVILPSARAPWEIYVNPEGERFMAEDEPSIDARERAAMAQTDWSFWVVYDEAIRAASPPLFRWEPEKLEAMFAGPDKDYVKAESLAELAAKTGMPEKKLASTIDIYNCAQNVGSDMLHRKHMPAPIGTGPFYAVRHYGCSISCYPGVHVDHSLRVLKADGTPFAGLYAAGEAIGIGFLGHGFLSGSIVSAAITFGLKLGREVLA